MITNRCNYNCEFCFGSFEEEELDLETAKKITKKLVDAGLAKISWAGGEPLLWPGIMDLIDYTRSLGVQTMLISNGELITDEVAEKLKTNLDWLNLPLEGSTSEMNEEMTRKKGHFERVIKLFKLFEHSRVKLKVNTVASKINIADIINMVPLIKKYGVKRWKIFQFYPVRGRAVEFKDKFLLDTNKFEQVRNQVLAQFEPDECMVVFENNEELEDSYFSITPTGLVYSSQAGSDVCLGDLKTQDIEDIVSHPALDKEKYWHRSKWVLEK
jgi:radical S-adenosyl methionine domain-containing protein 2